ncbi:MAG: ABC transporter ATP-binding protein [Dehalococcoidales bacterium]|nr:ABC transporter ATP-binding protein [Dehalococcoidales bacterium]
MVNDKTTKIESDINTENKPGVKFVVRLWRYVFGSAKTMCLIFMVLSITLSLLQPILAFIWRRYIDSANSFITGKNIFPVALLAVSYFVIGFVSNLIDRYTRKYEQIERLDVVQANRFQELLDSKMYRKISKLDPEYIEIPKINDTMNRVFVFTADGWSGINGGVMTPGYSVISSLVSVFAIGASLFILNPWLCLLLIIAAIPTLYVTYIGNKWQFKFIKDNSKLSREINYYQGLMLGNAAKEIKAFSLFDFFYGKWKTRIDDYTVKEKRVYTKQMVLATINNTISGLAIAGANIFAIVLFSRGEISLGALGAVMVLIGALIGSTSLFFSSIATVLSKKNEAAMFFDLMDLPDQMESGEKIATISEIKAENLKYRYPLTEKYVLENVNLTIRKGEKVALVGENGAGKTTFVKLISGLLSPSEGELKINGLPFEKVNPNSRYDVLSAVSQDPARYTTFTIGDNVFIGDTLKPRDENNMERALDFAGIADIDKTLLLGKDIGGTDLSGGQWQKLAIARGHYRNRNFIILDEPTGNLDPLAEAAIFKKYLQIAENKTVIFVTHRISVASLADRIVVFANGKVVEDGSHRELIEHNQEYARLYKTQAKWYNR